MLKFSLIVPTLNRVQELERFFQSLSIQDYTKFEVIVVDQNDDDRLDNLIQNYQQEFPILHLRESIRGLSRARNIALPYAKGDFIAFPDDDCIYSQGLLKKVARFFDLYPQWDGLVSRIFDLNEDENAFMNCGDDESGEMDFWKAYRVAVSCGIFIRSTVAASLRFDERLGVGSGTKWQTGDETDFVFRALKRGYRFYYQTGLTVRHPNPLKNSSFTQLIKRAYHYGVGHGYFLATHEFLSAKVLKAELNDELKQAPLYLRSGNWKMACYALTKGAGTYKGYRAGLKENNTVTFHKQIIHSSL